MKALLLLIVLALTLGLSNASETVNGAKKDLEKFKQDMSVELQKAESNLKTLKEKAMKSGDESYKSAIQDLTKKRDELRSRIEGLEVDAKGGWKEAKGRLSQSISGLNERIQKALKD